MSGMMGGGGGGGLGNIAGGIGAAVTTVAGIVEGAMKMKEAKAQAKKAEALRKSAKFVAKEQLRPEYKQVQDAQTIASTYGLNDRNRYEQNIDSQVANLNRDAVAVGSSGGASLAALSGAYGKSLGAYNDLAMKDSEVRQGKLNNLYQTTWNIGDEQRKLELEQLRKKENILAAASALDSAATANRINAHETAAGATMQGAAMYAGSAMPTKNKTEQQQAPQTQQVSQGSYRSAPQQNNYTTPSWYGSNTIADTTPMQGGQQVKTQPNNFYNWGSW